MGEYIERKIIFFDKQKTQIMYNVIDLISRQTLGF